jgi:uncharacterized protein YkwD
MAPLQGPSGEDYSLMLEEFEFSHEELELHAGINAYRRVMDLPPLKLLEEVGFVSRIHSEEMASGDVGIGHDGFKDRFDMLTELLPAEGMAENIAWSYSKDDPVQSALSDWISSEGHLDNIEGDFDCTGVGIASNVDGLDYFTQIFLRLE